MSTTEEPVAVREATTVAIELKLLVAIVGAIIFAVGSTAVAWTSLHTTVAEAQTRVGAVESRLQRLEDIAAQQAVTNRGVQDDLDHIRTVTDQTARDVRALQGAH